MGGDSSVAGATASVGGVGYKGSSPSHYVLSGQKMHLLERMKVVSFMNVTEITMKVSTVVESFSYEL